MSVIIANTKKEMIDHFYVRGNVFIMGQAIDWDIEFDGKDYDAVLFTCYRGDIPVGAARLIGNKVGRVATLSSYRNQGIGKELMLFIEDYAKSNNINPLILNAQCTVLEFYKKLGYVAVGDVFKEADIDHIKMTKKTKKG